MCLAFVLRLGFAVVFPAPITSDASDYNQLALNVINQHQYGFDSHPTSYRPPLYPCLLALMYLLPGNDMATVFFLQAVFGALAVLLIFKLGQLVAGQKVGLVAAAVVACDPHLIILSGMLLTETLFTLLLVAALFATLVGFTSTQKRWLVVAGVVWGLCSLTRPEGLLYLTVVLALGIYRYRNKIMPYILRSALVLGLTLATIAPWTIRNAIVQNEVVLLTTSGGVNFWMGNHPASKGGYYFPETGNPLADTALSEVARDRLGYEQGFGFIVSHPLTFLRNLGLKSAIMLSPLPSPAWAEIPLPPVVKKIGFVFSTLWFETLFVFGIAGIIFSRGRGYKELVGLLIVGLLFFIGFAADIRYRAPFLPVLALFAGVCCTNFSTVLKTMKEKRAGIWFASIIAFQVAVAVFALLSVDNRYWAVVRRFFKI